MQAQGSASKFADSLYRMSRMAPPFLALFALTICIVGKARLFPQLEPPGDEGTLSHLYQLAMVAQIPLMAILVVVATKRGLRKHFPILALQLGLWMIAAAAVPILGL